MRQLAAAAPEPILIAWGLQLHPNHLPLGIRANRAIDARGLRHAVLVLEMQRVLQQDVVEVLLFLCAGPPSLGLRTERHLQRGC